MTANEEKLKYTHKKHGWSGKYMTSLPDLLKRIELDILQKFIIEQHKGVIEISLLFESLRELIHCPDIFTKVSSEMARSDTSKTCFGLNISHLRIY